MGITVQYKDWPALKQAGALKAGQQEAFTLNYSYGRAKIAGLPKGSEVMLGEELEAKKIGETPLDILLPTGSYKISLRFGSSKSAIKSIRILKGEATDLDLGIVINPGTDVWKFETGASVVSSPAIGSDGTVYVGSYDNKLYAINGKTGTKLWGFETG